MGYQSVSENSHLLSRIAAGDGHGENSSYFDGWKDYDSNPFHPVSNPGGVIQMGLAENLLCLDLIKEWIKEHPEASICTEEGLNYFEAVANFQDYHGLPSFRQALARFMGKARGGRVSFNPDSIVMSGGGTGAQETLAFCLADPGDAFLVPTPYYPAFDRDFCWRTGVRLLPINCFSSNNFKLTKAALESAYETARKNNIRVKGVLMTNPSNPLGTTMDRDTLKTLLTFVNQKRIHLVCDEVFSGSVFNQADFLSVCELLDEEPSYDKSLIHIAYSLSKDLGLPGFRVGVIYSYNDTVVKCARRMSSFGLVSSQTQHLLSHMLNDDDFTSKYLAENKRRLHTRHEEFTSGLEKFGIKCLPSTAGLFIWMDLRQFLKENTENAELKLWRVIIDDVKLNISPGSSFRCTEPGWFRVCFANMDDATMHVALKRIGDFADKVKDETTQLDDATMHVALKRIGDFADKVKDETTQLQQKKRFNKKLRLSFCRINDGGITQHLMSPHLQSPRSPLVKASH
ncbi:1-aminocyclopropane-1-carboxylate synthase [Rhynchospora pubera]|uniref:1-aminocyclopropane-1-carboxylate synthase n=1 Tax=Rhynchospora pubera TaxID=906938 RepID=A0AAV8G924_9POAL|nr:1-aminocyclopropane-1-carboxylate synthase [Rhynchospora pubera]